MPSIESGSATGMTRLASSIADHGILEHYTQMQHFKRGVAGMFTDQVMQMEKLSRSIAQPVLDRTMEMEMIGRAFSQRLIEDSEKWKRMARPIMDSAWQMQGLSDALAIHSGLESSARLAAALVQPAMDQAAQFQKIAKAIVEPLTVNVQSIMDAIALPLADRLEQYESIQKSIAAAIVRLMPPDIAVADLSAFAEDLDAGSDEALATELGVPIELWPPVKKWLVFILTHIVIPFFVSKLSSCCNDSPGPVNINIEVEQHIEIELPSQPSSGDKRRKTTAAEKSKEGPPRMD